jgi:hypothetical protein
MAKRPATVIVGRTLDDVSATRIESVVETLSRIEDALASAIGGTRSNGREVVSRASLRKAIRCAVEDIAEQINELETLPALGDEVFLEALEIREWAAMCPGAASAR